MLTGTKTTDVQDVLSGNDKHWNIVYSSYPLPPSTVQAPSFAANVPQGSARKALSTLKNFSGFSPPPVFQDVASSKLPKINAQAPQAPIVLPPGPNQQHQQHRQQAGTGLASMPSVAARDGGLEVDPDEDAFLSNIDFDAVEAEVLSKQQQQQQQQVQGSGAWQGGSSTSGNGFASYPSWMPQQSGPRPVQQFGNACAGGGGPMGATVLQQQQPGFSGMPSLHSNSAAGGPQGYGMPQNGSYSAAQTGAVGGFSCGMGGQPFNMPFGSSAHAAMLPPQQQQQQQHGLGGHGPYGAGMMGASGSEYGGMNGGVGKYCSRKGLAGVCQVGVARMGHLGVICIVSHGREKHGLQIYVAGDMLAAGGGSCGLEQNWPRFLILVLPCLPDCLI
ncbi:hypothetical protein DUNSADRAFT_5146 [Dunaliella salina]|uniref:Uncharacterized protein n=1 Tax=Dunaliella salina TaxID=3046 RepID=A0ABQ7H7G2_DUNSA|nr:hypothetical protein DUNSADRAFT_5146 [Dunaliella salina]|eukprot:KAF5842774.1 hypothetical protein DUNSADRAFT_5146 [Dunaliella salina]